MQIRKIIALVVALFFTGIITAGAAEKFGVKVYDGATYDDSTTNFLSKTMHFNGACYRTNDSAAKVLEFYKKQPGLKLFAGSGEGAMFQKGNVDITIQNPWMDMKSRNMMKDTLISVVKH